MVFIFRVHDKEQYSTAGRGRIPYETYLLAVKVYTINQADVCITHVVLHPCVHLNPLPVHRVQTIIISIIKSFVQDWMITLLFIKYIFDSSTCSPDKEIMQNCIK